MILVSGWLSVQFLDSGPKTTPKNKDCKHIFFNICLIERFKLQITFNIKVNSHNCHNWKSLVFSYKYIFYVGIIDNNCKIFIFYMMYQDILININVICVYLNLSVLCLTKQFFLQNLSIVLILKPKT